MKVTLMAVLCASGHAVLGTASGADVLAAYPPAAAVSTVIAPSGGKQLMRNWETLVLFAVNLSRLDVMVNMSNVMGNTV